MAAANELSLEPCLLLISQSVKCTLLPFQRDCILARKSKKTLISLAPFQKYPSLEIETIQLGPDPG